MTSTGTSKAWSHPPMSWTRLRAHSAPMRGGDEPEAVQREDGSWLLAGWIPADEMAEQLGITLPEHRDYETVAGLVIGQLHHLPETGEVTEVLGWRFEVADMDGRRIDKVLATCLGQPAADGDSLREPQQFP